MKEYISIDEAAELLGFKKSSLYKKLHKREIPYYKLGKSVRFKRSELIKWIESKRVESNE